MKKYLITTVVAIILSVALIVFDIKGVFPLGLIWSGVLLILILLLALWKPRQTFWIFIALLPLESVIFLSLGEAISLRPFQVFGFLLVLTVLVKMAFKKNDFTPLRFEGMFLRLKSALRSKRKKDELDEIFEKEDENQMKNPRFNFLDLLIFLLPIFAFLSVINSPGEILPVKQALILTSFVFLYWLARNYLQNTKDKFEVVWFFVIGSLPVIFYGIFQALAFQRGWYDLEVFNGRINSTFTEPDWLGMYLVFLSAIVFWLKFLLWESKGELMIGKWTAQRIGNLFLNLYLLVVFIALVLTVARSAWLGFFGVAVVYFSLLFFWSWNKKGKWTWNIFFRKPFTIIYSELACFVVLIGLGMGLIYIFNLSSFHLWNRAGSSFSGIQKITISCEQSSEAPEKIQSIEELEGYNCRHINLEEIEKEKDMGFEIREIYRPDPNIEIRKDVYSKTWNSIKEHWVIGQGIGISSKILGTDENGAGLNASNIFLEAWISIGVLGLTIFFLVLFVPVLVVVGKLFASLFSSKKKMDWFKISFIALVFAALVIPNLFNAGWLLGYFWITLAISASVFYDHY
ncbi:MAG: O-antigen ligase family protein [Patescibacteria group bacterium]|jgi:hypothetical protein|nr:O-antigen ligase family protein [Patescibacteria group bacterium]